MIMQKMEIFTYLKMIQQYMANSDMKKVESLPPADLDFQISA